MAEIENVGHSVGEADGDTATRVDTSIGPDTTMQPTPARRVWCPLQLEVLRQKYGPLLPHFEKLEALVPARKHDGCLEEGRCKAYDSNDRTHRPKHVCADGKCGDQVISEQDLIPILLKAEIPILCFDESSEQGSPLDLEEQRPLVRVRPLRKGDLFVAISHVWFDGLGNSERNALPTCQIEKLRRSITAILRSGRKQEREPRQICFWLDALCIPVEGEHQRLKVEQISRMDEIYSLAHAVIILDSGLMSIANPYWSNSLLAQLMTCAWATRSWCFQEGALASSLAFHFKDTILLIRRRDIISRNNWVNPRRVVWLRLGSSSNEFRPFSKKEHRSLAKSFGTWPTRSSQIKKALWFASPWWLDKQVDVALAKHFAEQCVLAKPIWKRDYGWNRNQDAATFARTWNNLVGRYTTKAEDVPLIFATLLDFELDRLVPLESFKARMSLILKSFDSLPSALLFMNRSMVRDTDLTDDWWMWVRPGHGYLLHGGWIDVDHRDGDNLSAKLDLPDTPDNPVKDNQSWFTYTTIQLSTPLRRQPCRVLYETAGAQQSVQVEDLVLPEEAKALSRNETTYIIYETWPGDARERAKHAIYLYPSTAQDTSRRSTLKRPRVLSCRPCRIRQLGSDMLSPDNEEVLIGQRIFLKHPSSSFRIKLEPLPTDQGRLNQSGMYHARYPYLAYYALVAAILGLVVGCALIGIAVRVSAAMTQDIKIQKLCIAIFILAGVFMIFWGVYNTYLDIYLLRGQQSFKTRFERRRQRLVESRS